MAYMQTNKTTGAGHLHRLFASATREASAAMSRWTGGKIELELDEVLDVPLEDVCTELGIDDELMTMVVLGLHGEVGGEMILAFDENNGRRLAASLLRRPANCDEGLSPIEESALCETGNILGCAYMNALNRSLGSELVPSPPCFIQDYAAGVVQQASVSQAVDCDKVLICRTAFNNRGDELKWHVIFIPTEKMRQILESETCQLPSKK